MMIHLYKEEGYMAFQNQNKKIFTPNMKMKYSGLFEVLKEIPKSEIENNIEIIKYNKGDIIIEKERHGNELFIILEGVCNVIRQFETGISVIFYRVTNYDVIGFNELIGEHSRMREANVIAQTNVVVVCIERNTFLKWCSSYPTFSISICSRIIARLHETIKLFAECNSYPIYLSVVSYLLFAYAFYLRQNIFSTGDNSIVKTVKINETRREMAELIGVDVRSINRVIESLKNSEVITIIKGKINIDKCQYEKLMNIKYEGTEKL